MAPRAGSLGQDTGLSARSAARPFAHSLERGGFRGGSHETTIRAAGAPATQGRAL